MASGFRKIKKKVKKKVKTDLPLPKFLKEETGNPHIFFWPYNKI
jgi:hypothetical protein